MTVLPKYAELLKCEFDIYRTSFSKSHKKNHLAIESLEILSVIPI